MFNQQVLSHADLAALGVPMVAVGVEVSVCLVRGVGSASPGAGAGVVLGCSLRAVRAVGPAG